MKIINRKMFGGYYLSEDGEHLFGTKPYHKTKCGTIGDKYLLFCQFSELLLNDPPDGSMQESADMAPVAADAFMQDAPLENLTPYASAVVAYDRANGTDDMDIIEKRAFLLPAEFVGKTFAEVCLNHPVQYTEIVDDEGNVSRQPSHWICSQEIYG